MKRMSIPQGRVVGVDCSGPNLPDRHHPVSSGGLHLVFVVQRTRNTADGFERGQVGAEHWSPLPAGRGGDYVGCICTSFLNQCWSALEGL